MLQALKNAYIYNRVTRSIRKTKKKKERERKKKNVDDDNNNISPYTLQFQTSNTTIK